MFGTVGDYLRVRGEYMGALHEIHNLQIRLTGVHLEVAPNVKTLDLKD